MVESRLVSEKPKSFFSVVKYGHFGMKMKEKRLIRSVRVVLFQLVNSNQKIVCAFQTRVEIEEKCLNTCKSNF